MAVSRPVQGFYAPISAGGMAHVGPIPQSHVSYHVISPIRGGEGSVRVTRHSAYPQPIRVGERGMVPGQYTPIVHAHPIPVGAGSLSGINNPVPLHYVGQYPPANWVNHPHS